MSILGNRVLRTEDDRFLRGKGQYVENVPLENAAHVTFVRSLLAHAKINSVDTSAATELPGVQVVAGNAAKFGQSDHLRAILFATGDAILVEASPRDRVWGIGLTASSPLAGDPATWRGKNLLGFALVTTRSLLRAAR